MRSRSTMGSSLVATRSITAGGRYRWARASSVAPASPP